MSGEKIQVREGWWRQRCGDVVRVWVLQREVETVVDDLVRVLEGE